jgi:hypothetical protein
MYCRTAYTVGAIAEVLNALGEPRWVQAAGRNAADSNRQSPMRRDIDFRDSSLDITVPPPREGPKFVPLPRLICRRSVGCRPAENGAPKELISELACEMGRVLREFLRVSARPPIG